MELLSTTSRVSAPIIIVSIGEKTFGLYNKSFSHLEVFGKYYNAIKVDYPNYLKSLAVRKINGQLNTYTLMIEYAITPLDDPNLIDKLLSTVSRTRKIRFTYGDATIPGYMYRDEEAIITQVTSVPDVISSKITYTILAVSTALGLNGNTKSYEKKFAKPSDEIKKLLRDKSTGLVDIFYGMHDYQQVMSLGLIKSNDRPVWILARTNITVLDYLKYLVECMSSIDDSPDDIKKKENYVLTIYDEVSLLDGPYFKVSSALTSVPDKTSLDIYQIDIGYPTKDLVLSFSILDNQAYALLYDYSLNITTTDSVYRVGDDGELRLINSPVWTKSKQLLETTEATRTWWSKVTQYPIKATLVLRGLLRSIILMSYIKVGIYYYGKKHNTSGIYIVNQLDDYIDISGYRTTLSLIRILGDELQ